MRLGKRVLVRGAAALVVIGAALGAWKHEAIAEKALDLRFGQTLPAPDFPPPADAAEARLQDLEYLARLTEVDRSFSSRAARAFAKRVDALRARAPGLTDPQFFLGVAEAGAQADNAHTGVDLGLVRRRFNSAPVRLAWFPEGLHVVRAATGHADLLGARVLAIDGIEPEALAREAARFVGGTPEYRRSVSTFLLESPQLLNALRPQAPADRLRLRLADAQGVERNVELAAVAAAEAPAASKPGRILAPRPLPSEKPGAWHAMLDEAGDLPPSLRDPQRSAYAATLGDGVLYLHLWQIRDDDHGKLETAIRGAVGRARAPWRRIILDLRFNAGGDYPVVYRALESLAERLAPGGRLAILVDNTTFSAAIIAAALAKHFAAGRAVIVGEKPGDRLAFWAEGTSIELPHSKIKVNISTGLHDWEKGCRSLDCWWPNLFYDVAAGSLDPQVPVAWRFEDYRRGVDPVLARAIAPGALSAEKVASNAAR